MCDASSQERVDFPNGRSGSVAAAFIPPRAHGFLAERGFRGPFPRSFVWDLLFQRPLFGPRILEYEESLLKIA